MECNVILDYSRDSKELILGAFLFGGLSLWGLLSLGAFVFGGFCLWGLLSLRAFVFGSFCQGLTNINAINAWGAMRVCSHDSSCLSKTQIKIYFQFVYACISSSMCMLTLK